MSSIALPRLRTRTRSDQPAWVRPALVAVMALASVLCLWNLTRNGYSNDYYAAAAKSASVDWKAWFFGSLDPGSFITVDKPPLATWLSGLSARVFGFSSFSILLPSALSTIAAVGLLFATVRRLFGPAAGIVAATVLALTPVTVAVGRVNNPDALLVLLLVAAGYFTVRAIESGKTKYLLWCGAMVGLAFMTKMLQGWMVVPALAGAYLLAGPPAVWTRIRQLALAGLTMVVVSAAWPVAVTLWPGSKPYIGGSTNGSVWNLIFGYNGFGRIFGEGGGGPGGHGGGGGGGMGASFGGQSGIGRMFNEQVGGQIGWLLPTAAIALAAGLWLTRREPRTSLRRAGFVLFGLWALVHVAVFSTQQGIFHPYYVSALAPAVAALVGAGLVTMWRWARESWAGVAALDAALVAAAFMAVHLLARTPDFMPALRVVIPVAMGIAVMASFALRDRRAIAVWAVAGAIAVLAGPAAYAADNLGRALNGNNVLAGPTSAGGMGGGPGGGGRPGGMSAGGPGSGLGTQAIRYLEAHQGSTKYLVAANGSQTTSSIITSTGKAVVTIGGFSGQDAAPTLSQLKTMVAKGQLEYVLVSSGGQGGRPGGGGGPGGGGNSSLTSWVTQHGTAVKGLGLSGSTLYRVSS
jgi:4-amino-4-deoxy-L-arabinose transferase-like glycosyltransferase